MRGVILPNIKAYYTARVIETMRHERGTDTQTCGNHTVDHTNMLDLYFDKGAKTIQQRKELFQ